MRLRKNDTVETLLTVISQTAKTVNVLFPSLDVPVEMTIKYFEHLKSTGGYVIQYDLNRAS